MLKVLSSTNTHSPFHNGKCSEQIHSMYTIPYKKEHKRGYGCENGISVLVLFYQSLFINHCVKTSVHMWEQYQMVRTIHYSSTCCNGKFYDMLWSANSKTQLLLASPLEITRIYFWKNISYDVKASDLHRMSTFSWNCNKADLILIFLKKKKKKCLPHRRPPAYRNM